MPSDPSNEEIGARLVKMGYKHFPPSQFSDLTVIMNWQKPTDRPQPLCETNDRPPPLTVFLHEVKTDSIREPKTLSVELVGERGGQWHNLTVYGIALNADWPGKVLQAEANLKAAWRAVAGAVAQAKQLDLLG